MDDWIAKMQTKVKLRANPSFDIRKRIQLSEADICPQGRPTCRCLEMRAQIWTAPPSGSYLFSAAYSHGGDVRFH